MKMRVIVISTVVLIFVAVCIVTSLVYFGRYKILEDCKSDKMAVNEIKLKTIEFFTTIGPIIWYSIKFTEEGEEKTVPGIFFVWRWEWGPAFG